MYRTGAAATLLGSVAATSRSRSSRSRNSPGSAGTRAVRSRSSQAGWVKSPVPMSVTPLRRAHQVNCSRSLFLLHA
ncbi:hypothetical protein SAMN05421833_12125 [Microbispora rosea]|uniref:Uncharacterized protein n=1 Tax=Microbispora rosea TaxID=58117 RepID=A0A1N7F8X9_9ACTN|nr:hypothetical protein [Microbispora rosea]SIR96675.1 hypothetical protein SAMN05421833_12125 [Microbispora rosea]